MNFTKLAAMGVDRAISVGVSPDEWMQSALELFLRTNPDFDGTTANVEMIDSDEASQKGHGQIVARRDNVMIRVPFFVNEGKLQPLDLFYMEDEVYPLSKERIDDVFFNQGAIGQVATHPSMSPMMPGGEEGPAGVTRISGQPQVRSYDKMASDLLDGVLSTARPAAVQSCIGRAEQTQIDALLRGDRADLFDKMASVVDDPPPVDAEVRAIRVKLSAPGYYQVEELAEARPGDPFPHTVRTVTLIGEEAPKYFSKSAYHGVLDQVDTDGSAVASTAPEGGGVQTDSAGMIEKIASGGGMTWRDDGRSRVGLVCALHGYDGSPADGQIFISHVKTASGRTQDEHALADSFHGQPVGDVDLPSIVAQDLDAHAYRQHPVRWAKTAAWVWQEDDGSYHATKPFTVKQQMMNGDRYKVAGLDPLGRRVDFETSSVLRIVPASQTKKAEQVGSGYPAYYVPRSYWLVAAGDLMETMKEAAILKGLDQAKHSHYGGRPLEVVRSGRHYRLEAPGIEKTAASKDLTRDEAMIFLATYGATKEAQDQVMDRLAHHERATVLGLDWSSATAPVVEPTMDKVALDPSQRKAVMAVLDEVRPTLWKVASEFAQEGLGTYMTDTALSLDLAEENQIDDFIDKVPVLEEAIKTCAQLLVQSRMEHIDMVPEDVREAMMSLEKVMQSLRGLDAE